MSKNTYITDGGGSGRNAIVDEGGYLRVQSSFIPPDDDRDLKVVYRNFLTLDGDGTTNSMLVDGSTTSQLFFIQGEPNNDIYITTISFFIQADGLTLGNDFAGNGTLLTNGCRLYYEDKNGEINVGTNLDSNFSFVRLCQGNAPFGNDTFAFIKNAGVPAIFPNLNFKKVFGFNQGLKLLSGTNNKLILEINDDLSTGLGTNPAFNVLVFGFKIIKE
jgi:hypothetical protein